jgi:hypothetical protein
MKIVYSKLSLSGPKKTLNSILELNYNLNSDKISERFVINFGVQYSDDFNIASNQIIKYSELTGVFYVLSNEKDRLTFHFGLTKIKGTKLKLIKKEFFDREIENEPEINYLSKAELMGESPHSHYGFISDDFKTFFIQENFGQKKEQIKATKPINIKNPIQFHNK